MIGADTLTFLSAEGMVDAIGGNGEGETRGHCLACFTGKYPTEIYPINQPSNEDADLSKNKANNKCNGINCHLDIHENIFIEVSC